MSNGYTLASFLTAPPANISPVAHPQMIRRASSICNYGGDDRGDIVAKPFPYRFPHVSVWRRGNATERAAWYIAYDCPIEKRRIQRAVSPDTEQTAKEARRISELVGQATEGSYQHKQLVIEDRERKPLLGYWKNKPHEYVRGHLEEYRAWMRSRNLTEKHIVETYSAARKMIRVCRFRTINEIEGVILESRVGELLREKRDLSLRQCNRYLKACRQLTAWMALPKVGRSRVNPLKDIDLYNEATDRRHKRRALSHEELAHLIKTTKSGVEILGFTGEARAMLYLLKFYTGFRNPEIESLMRESFHLDCTHPYIVVEAAFSKHRRRDEQPIDGQFAQSLKTWLEDKPYSKQLINLPDKPNQMLLKDLTAAGIPYKTHDGFFDLHSFRHTYGTLLGKSGASVKTVQELMRHSDVRTTMGYMHSTRFDQVQALSSLPVLTSAQQADSGEAVKPISIRSVNAG